MRGTREWEEGSEVGMMGEFGKCGELRGEKECGMGWIGEWRKRNVVWRDL
jgi:hypothetical protein